LLVADANIWIDLDAGGLLCEAVAALGLETTDFVLHELVERSLGERIRSMGVTEHSLTPEQVAEVIERRRKDNHPSVADYSALILASTLKVGLVTGDKHLRIAASRDGVEVHGVIWVVERLVDDGLDKARAADAIEVMIMRGARLPDGAVRELLGRYRS
jgi:predicted nucleic acid-binding protein